MSNLLEGLLIGVQIATAHYGPGYSENEWATPGIYVRHESGASGGMYRNSNANFSAWLGWTFETPGKMFAVTVGGVTGYKRSVTPLLAPSIRLPLKDEWFIRATVVPSLPKYDITGAVMFAVERSF